MKIAIAIALAFICVSICSVSLVYADLFGNGVNSFDIAFVTIGNPGNLDDTGGKPDPAGSVAEVFRMGQFEISEGMIDKVNALSGLNILHDGRGENKPATRISWFEAAQFVNWLNTSTGNTPAYNFDISGNFQLWTSGETGYDPNNLYRNSEARYFLPSADEWYKAAFYDPVRDVYYDFPTGSDTPPRFVASGTEAGTAVYNQQVKGDLPADIELAGGLSPFGTMAQAGNVFEWMESDVDQVNDSTSSPRGIRGNSWDFHLSMWAASNRYFGVGPSLDDFNLGFRVASVPEPSSQILGAIAVAGLLVRRTTKEYM